LRTDERLDTEGSLRKAAQTLALVRADPSEWKWALLAIHSAVQGIFVIALSLGNNLLTLKSGHAAGWLRSHRSGEPYPSKLDLDYFGELYKKAKEHSKFSATQDHDKAVGQLNELRNNFIHFHAQGWSIQLAGLPTICLDSLEIVEHLGWKFGGIYWHTNAQSRRARRHFRQLVRELKQLDENYNSK
jgi:hypothetical protein